MEVPAVPSAPIQHLIRRVARAGFKADFVRAAILPEWWSADCEADASLLGDVEVRVARFLGLPVSTVRSSGGPLRAPTYAAARLRRVSNIDADRLGPAIHAALRIAEAVVRSLRPSVPAPTLPPRDPNDWRRELQAHGAPVALGTVVRDLWARGIPVVHVGVLPSPKFQGLACLAGGRPVVILGHAIDEPPRLAFWLLHEAGHLANDDCAPDAPVVDEVAEESTDDDPRERRADAFAWTVLTGDVEIPPPPSLDPRALARHAAAHAARLQIDAGVVAWSLAHHAGAYQAGKLALSALYRATGGKRVLREEFDGHVDRDAAGETDGQLLRCVAGDPDGDAAAR